METLQKSISLKHEEAEKMPFNRRMFNGELNKKEYLLYLLQQQQIFEAIESKGLPSKTLSRIKPIAEDIKELKEQGITTDEILTSTLIYTTYINNLSYEEVLPHIYLNYLALLYGGQYIKKKVPSSGKLYKFEFVKEAMQSIRAAQKDQWADEVNKGFDYLIKIFDQLENLCQDKLITKQ